MLVVDLITPEPNRCRFSSMCVLGHALLGSPPFLVGCSLQQMSWVETTAGWAKSAANPVLDGNLGTCFDISVLKEGDLYRMWFSWRPENSLALTESSDGVHWSEPTIVLGPNPATGWQRHPANPIVRPGRNKWDADAVYKPYAIFDGSRWMLWYNGRNGSVEQIGLVTHQGRDLDF